MVDFTKGSSRELIDSTELQDLLNAGTVIVDDRRRRPFYQDGRFLTAADLTRDQNYFLTRQADLGRSGGTGIVQGLMVKAPENSIDRATSVVIKAGHGVTPSGEQVIIPSDRQISLTNVAQIQRLDAAFGLSSIPNQPLRNLSGLFVLALRPVEYTADPIATYPTSLTGQRTVSDGYIIEATAVTLIPYADPGNGNPDLLRARVAREIFVVGAVGGLPTDTLPLAMIFLRRGVIEWIDPFMVRREIGAEYGSILSLGFAPRALREAQIQQYEQHLQEILDSRNDSDQSLQFSATDYFQALPSAGSLPAAAINSADFTQFYFPPTVDVDLAFIPADEIAVLVEESLLLQPIDLTLNSQDLDSTSVLVMIPIHRQRVRQLKNTLPTLSRQLLPAAPSLLAKRNPSLEALQRLTTPRLTETPLLNPQDTTDSAWRQALANTNKLWYVRRRNLPYRVEVIGFSVAVGGNEYQTEQNLLTTLNAVNLTGRVNEIRSICTPAAEANVLSLLSSPKFQVSPKLLNAVVYELEGATTLVNQQLKLDRVAVFQVAERFGDPKFGEGIQRLEAVNPQLQEIESIIDLLATSKAIPELDRLGRLLSEAQLPTVSSQLVTFAKASNSQEIYNYVMNKLKEIGG